MNREGGFVMRRRRKSADYGTPVVRASKLETP